MYHIIAAPPYSFYSTPGGAVFPSFKGCVLEELSGNVLSKVFWANRMRVSALHHSVSKACAISRSMGSRVSMFMNMHWHGSFGKGLGKSNAHCGDHDSCYARGNIDCSNRTVEYSATVRYTLYYNIISRELVRSTIMLTSSSSYARSPNADRATVVVVRVRSDIST